MENEEIQSNNKSVDLVLLKKEVDALQIAIHSKQLPWYKNIPTILSILALLFSFGTTAVSYLRTRSQDIQSSRIELRGLLQRLAALPRENIEITKKYEKTDPAAIASVTGLLNQENSLLARQAAEITKNLPEEFVSATEHFAIGSALLNSYNISGAIDSLTKAIDVSTDMNDRVGALRVRANALFISGQPETGRVDYQRALNVFQEFKINYNDYTKRSIHIWTELSWAYSEVGVGLNDNALQHVANAQNIVSGLIPSPGAEQLKSQINHTKSIIATANNLPKSTMGLPLGVIAPVGVGQ